MHTLRIEEVYINIWLWSTGIFCLIQIIRMRYMSDRKFFADKPSKQWWPILYCLAFALWIGFRPLDKSGWADTSNYLRIYNFLLHGVTPVTSDVDLDLGNEWLWDWILHLFTKSLIEPEWWFFVIDVGYIGFMYAGVRRLFKTHTWAAMLFCISSFSFFTYSYNGLRNGLACSMIIYAFSYYVNVDKSKAGKRNMLIAIVISLLAMGIHRTTALPSLCVVACILLGTDIKRITVFWIVAIILSFFFGTELQSLIINIGFDKRLTSYGEQLASSAKDVFSRTGFRWDFLLYSLIPIIEGLYVNLKCHINNRPYNILLCTYILANSFWVVMNTVIFSNRFAYLSWFMYPIVMAYPVLNLKIWKHQGRMAALLLGLNMGITIALNIFIF